MIKIATVCGLAGVIAIVGINFVSAYNFGNRTERAIEAQYEQNKNVLSRLSNSVVEAAKVPALAKDHIKEIVAEAMEGRYGSDGSKAVFQAITENYPGQIDPSLYLKIQTMIESGRTDFAAEQSKLIDKVRIYKTELGTVWRGTFLSVAGYPKINLDEFKIIQSNYTLKSFETGVDEGIKLQ